MVRTGFHDKNLVLLQNDLGWDDTQTMFAQTVGKLVEDIISQHCLTPYVDDEIKPIDGTGFCYAGIMPLIHQTRIGFYPYYSITDLGLVLCL